MEQSVPAARMTILIRDLKLDMSIGIYDEEKRQAQKVLVNVEAEVTPPADMYSDRMEDWVSYETIVRRIQQMSRNGHIELLETFAALIAQDVLLNAQIRRVCVRLEKPDAIDEAHSVGVELTLIA